MKTSYPLIIAASGLLLLNACAKRAGVQPEVVAPAPAPVVTAPAAPVTTMPSYSADEQFLLNQNPGAYTVQVLSAQNPQTAASFMQRYANYGLRQVQTMVNGQPHYVVLYGMFGSKTEAQQAARAFRDTWVRTVGSVQAQIGGAR